MTIRRGAILIVLAAGLAGCSTQVSTGNAQKAERVTAEEWLAMSIPEEGDVAEGYFGDQKTECTNATPRAGISTEFLDRIRSSALGADDSTPMSDVLAEFCSTS